MATLLNVVGQKQTYINILYLLLSFPLGLLYFIFVVVGISVGVGTLVIWIGLPILFLTIMSMWGMAALERETALRMLHVDMPPVSSPFAKGKSWWNWLKEGLADPTTWKSLVYLLAVKFPLGIFSFTLVIALLVSSLALTLEPVAYLINTNINMIIGANGAHSQSWLPFFVYSDGSFDASMFFRSFIGVPVGIVLGVISLHLLNGLAWLSGELTRLMLSPCQTYKAVPKNESLARQEMVMESWQQAR